MATSRLELRSCCCSGILKFFTYFMLSLPPASDEILHAVTFLFGEDSNKPIYPTRTQPSRSVLTHKVCRCPHPSLSFPLSDNFFD